MLQRAVMGLCRADVIRVEEIADHLSVHVDLVAFIVTELMDLGYLDNQGNLSHRGLEVIENDMPETEEMVAGYVFQDPWNGDLWPRFAETLDYCEVELNDNGFPALLLGTTGRPKRELAFTVLPKSESFPASPSSDAVVDAVSRHRKGLRFKEVDENEEDSLGNFMASGVQINRVSFVEEEPRPVFLMTYLYVPESASAAMDWYACDPFGLGQSARLRRRVETVMNDDPRLFDVIKRLVGETLHANYDDQQRWLEGIHLQADLEVSRRLTVNIRSHAIFHDLHSMESARQEIQLIGHNCPNFKINGVLNQCRKVLESVFASFVVDYPLDGIWRRVYVQRIDRFSGRRNDVPQRDRSVLSATYDGAFRSLGFAGPFPRPLLDVRPELVRTVSEFHKYWQLRALVTTTAMLAQREPTHPLAEAAKISPELLNKIDDVASAGGGASHADGDSASLDDVEKNVEKVYHIVAVLLGIVTTD